MTNLRLNWYTTTKQSAYLLADGKSKANTVRIQVSVEFHGDVILKKFWNFFLWNTSARVFDRNEKSTGLKLVSILIFFLLSNPHVHLDRAIFSELAGIWKKVHTYLLNPLFVSNDRPLGHVDLDHHVSAVSLHFNHTNDFVYSRTDFTSDQPWGKSSSLDLCVVKCVVYAVEHHYRRKPNDF